MKKLLLLIILTAMQQSITAQCNVGSYTVTTNAVITGSCVITGNLTIQNGATLNVDLSAAAADTFVVRGNILLQGNAVLWVHGDSTAHNDQFIVSNVSNNQRSITTQDSSRVQLENVEFRTQEGNLSSASSYYMNYYAIGKSILYVNNCWLNTNTAWLLCNLSNHSTLLTYSTNEVPTESYLQDTAQVALHGAATKMGLWMAMQNVNDTLNLPASQASPYTWKVGRNAGGLRTQWYLEIDTANPGLGIEVFPNSKTLVNGSGVPATGELKVALMFSNYTDSIKNLAVGLQNRTVADGPGGVTLHNVNLGPIAWQVYALISENLYIKNSTINEIGIAGPSKATIDSSVLQLGLLASVGQGGSTMTINNSSIWNQGITAANSSTLTLNNCNVTGSAFSTVDASSHITVNGGCFFQNPAGCTPNTMVNISTGVPNCNPYVQAGYPQNLSPASVTFNGVSTTCPTAVETMQNLIEQVKVYPDPFTAQTTLQTGHEMQNATLSIYNLYGQLVKQIQHVSGQTVTILRDGLSSGLYFISLTQENKNFPILKIVVDDK